MSFAQFRADQRTVDATERCLQRITEAVIKLGADRLATIAPQLPFERIRGLGNILRHEYDNIDHGSIFSVVTDELPGLLTACQEALSKGS